MRLDMIRKWYFGIFLILVFLSSFLNSAFGKDYHAAIIGTADGDGSIDNPWDLKTALNKKTTILPGDTLFIHEGRYAGRFVVELHGDSSANIIITNYQDDLVVLDGSEYFEYDSHPVIWLDGGAGCQYVILDGLEVTNTHPERWTDYEGSFAPHPQNVQGVLIDAPYCKLKNMVIHDNHGNGILCPSSATDAEVTGCLIYYNGWDAPDRSHCYGLYVQNDNPESNIRIHDNIIFSNFNKGFHVYVTNGTVISNIHVYDNICFEAGAPSNDGPFENNIFIGGLRPLDGIEVLDNHAYSSRIDRGNPIRVGYYEKDNQNIVVSGNYSIGGKTPISIRYCENVTLKNNYMFSKGHPYGAVASIIENGQDLTTYTWDNNKYFYTGSRSDYMDGYDWNGWRTTHGFDANGTFTTSAPSQNEHFLKHYPDNEYANLVIYDWKKLNSVDVDLSSVLPSGSRYQIYDVQNIKGEPVTSGTYHGGTVSVPTNLTTVTPVFGDGVPNQPTHTAQEFSVYIVRSNRF
jgi:hypothetical protein